MGMLVKGVILWVLVPAGLFFAGYKLIGPKIGQVPNLPLVPATHEKLVTQDAQKPSVNPEVQADTDGPKPTVDISVDPASRMNKDGERPRKKKKKTTDQTRATPSADRTRDEASGDAAMPRESDPASGGGG